MCQRNTRVRFRLEALGERICPSSTVVLPISAFTSAQGTMSTYNPPLPDFIGWTNSVFDPGATSSDPFRFLSADYTGGVANYLMSNGIDLHTQITGHVTQTTMDNGLMEVSVNLEATHALAWIVNTKGIDISQPGAQTTAPLELGYRPQELVANPSLAPTLANIHFQITFQQQAGTPMPDLTEAFFFGNAPPGFAPSMVEFQAWGSGTLRPGTTVGAAGQNAVFNTSEFADFVNPIPGTLASGFVQENINIVPTTAGAKSIEFLNGWVFITDLANGNDHITVSGTPGGGAKVTTNFGNGTFSPVTNIVINLTNGNSRVVVNSLLGATVNVACLDGNNQIIVGNQLETMINAGGGNNQIIVGTANPAMVFVAGNGNNQIAAGRGQNNIYVGGNGNNNILAAGDGDYLHLWGNGNNRIFDIGMNATVYLAGDGNNLIFNNRPGSFTHVLGAMGKNTIYGPFGP